jgi:hypothetical protein
MVDEVRGPLPIKVDSTSNGEFRPVPLTRDVARANSEAKRRIGEHAKRVGLGRRAFLQSLCGAATTLLTLKDAFALVGNTGGVYSLPKESTFEPAAAADVLAGDEFIFDVQTHLVDPTSKWRQSAGKYWAQAFAARTANGALHTCITPSHLRWKAATEHYLDLKPDHE